MSYPARAEGLVNSTTESSLVWCPENSFWDGVLNLCRGYSRRIPRPTEEKSVKFYIKYRAGQKEYIGYKSSLTIYLSIYLSIYVCVCVCVCVCCRKIPTLWRTMLILTSVHYVHDRAGEVDILIKFSMTSAILWRSNLPHYTKINSSSSSDHARCSIVIW